MPESGTSLNAKVVAAGLGTIVLGLAGWMAEHYATDVDDHTRRLTALETRDAAIDVYRQDMQNQLTDIQKEIREMRKTLEEIREERRR